jgi:hypothetical protein
MATCTLISQTNEKATYGYAVWKLTFALDDKRYSFIVSNYVKMIVINILKYSAMKAFNYAKKHKENIQ